MDDFKVKWDILTIILVGLSRYEYNISSDISYNESIEMEHWQ